MTTAEWGRMKRGTVEVMVKGGVVVTGAEIKPGRQGRQRFNLLRGDFNCYTAN